MSRRDRIRKDPFPPGDILYELFMRPQGVTQKGLSEKTGLSITTINRILQGTGGITPRVALALSKFFKNDKYYWIQIQNEYDFWELEQHVNRK